jgi:hypothetical protein
MDIMSSNAKRTLLDGEIEVILPGRKVSEKVHYFEHYKQNSV